MIPNSICLSILLAAASVTAAAGADAGPLRIEVIRGDGAIHNIRDKELVRPLVRVVRGDNPGQPVVGASVTFRLPDSGPSGSFSSGRILTLTTNPQGEAPVTGAFRTNLQLGAWEIRVSATHQGETARAAIAQTNAAPVDAFASRGKAGRQRMLLAMLAVGAAGAAVGVTSYGRGRGGVSAVLPGGVASTPIPGPGAPPTITAGSGSVGAP